MPTKSSSPAPIEPGSFLVHNLQRLMRHHRVSQMALARETGLKQPSIHRILSGKLATPRQGTISALAEFFNVKADDLRYRDLSDQSLLPTNLRGFRIAMMTAREAGFPAKKPPMRHDGDSIVVYHEVSEDSFAFPVSDRAMEPRFSPGDIIVVDPERLCGPGNFVAARVDGLEEAVVRSIGEATDKGQHTLLPLSAQYPKLTGRVIGYLIVDVAKTQTEIARRVRQAQGRLTIPGVSVRETFATRRVGGRR